MELTLNYLVLRDNYPATAPANNLFLYPVYL